MEASQITFFLSVKYTAHGDGLNEIRKAENVVIYSVMLASCLVLPCLDQANLV